MNKVYKQNFRPVNPVEARQTVRNDKFTMHENDFNLDRIANNEEREVSKSKRISGDFKRSNQFDNSLGNDWNIRNTKEMIVRKKHKEGLNRATLRNTAD